jgi:hypothetical protein
MFFSEEKNQKTFAPAPAEKVVVMTLTLGIASKRQKSFGSFLQKRTSFLVPIHGGET